MPETRGLIVATVRSTTLRTIARRTVEDRGGLLRDLADPPVEVREGTLIEAGPPPMIVTSEGSETERGQEGPR